MNSQKPTNEPHVNETSTGGYLPREPIPGETYRGLFDDESALEVLRRRIDAAVLEYLRAEYGPGAVIAEPYPKPANLIDAMLVTRMVSDRALTLRIDWAKKARGAGTPWRELVAPLGIDTSDEWTDGPKDAFRLVAGPPSMAHDPIYAHWTCASCGQLIRDSGPDAGHPVDAEENHADGCARFAREIAAWQARHGD